ncbi:hypothetical protein BT96DRAFT_1017764, partial [Gymnopus androsaceus JB14]
WLLYPLSLLWIKAKGKIPWTKRKHLSFLSSYCCACNTPRLKVDHGWHKQSLNQVENLYFKHSQTRPRQESSTNYEPVNSTEYECYTTSPQSDTRTPCAGQWNRFPTPLSYYSALSTTNTSSATNLAPTETHGILRTTSQVPSSSNERAFSQSSKRAQPTCISLVPSLKHPPPSSDPTIQQQKQPRTVHFAVPLLPASAKSRPASINSAPSYPTSTFTPSAPISVPQNFTQFTSPPTECTQTSSTRTYNSFWSSHGTNPLTPQASFSSVVEPRYATAKDGESGVGIGIGTGITAYP